MNDLPASFLSRKEVQQARAHLYQQIRAFFLQKGVLEVETPVFSEAGNPDPSIQSLSADFRYSRAEKPLLRYAHTSPEFAMKRLLTEGIGDIYQICKVFRPGELGRLHNPEFTMLEWYRPTLNYRGLMDEIEELLQILGIAEKCQRISYARLFKDFLDLDIMFASVSQLKSCAANHKIEVVGSLDDYNEWCALLLSHIIEPKLKTMGAIFVYDYPVSQAALAKIRNGQPGAAERFELYINGIEVANGYQELTSSVEYRVRFIQENEQRQKRGLDQIPMDENLLVALSAGFPECAGVAMGLDRLLMCRLKKNSIKDILSFHFNNA